MKRFQLDCTLSPDPSTYPDPSLRKDPESCSSVAWISVAPSPQGYMSPLTAPHICVLPSAPALSGNLPSTSGVHLLLLALFTPQPSHDICQMTGIRGFLASHFIPSTHMYAIHTCAL